MLSCRYPEPFTAYFLAGSDPDFVVLPQAGELLPVGTVGTHITVGFKPRMYGKKHKATLVIQVSLHYSGLEGKNNLIQKKAVRKCANAHCNYFATLHYRQE